MYKFIFPINNYNLELLKKQTRKRKPITEEVEIYISIYQNRIRVVDYKTVVEKTIKLLLKSFIKSKNKIIKISVEKYKKERGSKERMEIEVLELE